MVNNGKEIQGIVYFECSQCHYSPTSNHILGGKPSIQVYKKGENGRGTKVSANIECPKCETITDWYIINWENPFEADNFSEFNMAGKYSFNGDGRPRL